MGKESEADWYSGVRVKMTPNIQLHRSVNSRLRRLSPPGELGRYMTRQSNRRLSLLEERCS
jgi:hypothetical protein